MIIHSHPTRLYEGKLCHITKGELIHIRDGTIMTLTASEQLHRMIHAVILLHQNIVQNIRTMKADSSSINNYTVSPTIHKQVLHQILVKKHLCDTVTRAIIMDTGGLVDQAIQVVMGP